MAALDRFGTDLVEFSRYRNGVFLTLEMASVFWLYFIVIVFLLPIMSQVRVNEGKMV